MKLNKFVCGCKHEFYDTNTVSVCDACGRTVHLRPPKTTVDIDVKLVEAYKTNADQIREAIARISETVRTRGK